MTAILNINCGISLSKHKGGEMLQNGILTASYDIPIHYLLIFQALHDEEVTETHAVALDSRLITQRLTARSQDCSFQVVVS